MGKLDVLDVYNKIKEIRDSRKTDEKKSITIDRIAQELNGNKEIIKEYVTALTILELVEFTDNENIDLIKKNKSGI